MRQWVLGEFASEAALLEALRALRAQGHRRLDAYTPFPVEGLDEALGLERSPLPTLTLAGGLGGAALAYLVQWFTNAVDWPINVGDRPLHSAPTFIPITFESGVLAAALTLFGGLLWLFGFPHVTHPVFRLEAFRTASVDGFWVSVTTGGGAREADEASDALRALGASQVSVVPEEVMP